MRETVLLFIVLTEYCSSSCLFCPVLSSLTKVVTIRYPHPHDTIRIVILESRYDTYRDTC